MADNDHNKRGKQRDTGEKRAVEASRTLEKYLFVLVGVGTISLIVLTYLYVDQIYVDPLAGISSMTAVCYRKEDKKEIIFKQERNGKLEISGNAEINPSKSKYYLHGNCNNLHGDKFSLETASLFGLDSIIGQAVVDSGKCCVVGIAKSS